LGLKKSCFWTRFLGVGQRVGQKGGHFKNEKAFIYRGFSEGGHLLGQDSGHLS